MSILKCLKKKNKYPIVKSIIGISVEYLAHHYVALIQTCSKIERSKQNES